MRGTRVLAIDDLVEIFRVSEISWFQFAHSARSLTAPPKVMIFIYPDSDPILSSIAEDR